MAMTFTISPAFRHAKHWFPRVAAPFWRATSADILVFNGCDVTSAASWKQHPCNLWINVSTANMHDWSLIRILFCLTQNFVSHGGRVSLSKRDVLQQV